MTFWRTFLDLLLPRHCVMCDAELNASETDICNVCLCNVEYIRWESATDNPFLRRIWDKHDVEAAGSSLYYNSLSDLHNVFIAIKYFRRPKLGYRLAQLCFSYWQNLGLAKDAEYIIPVPLSTARMLKRGYNQAEWISQGIARQTGIPVNAKILVRSKHIRTQTHKNATERWENTRNIFSVRKNAPDLNGKTILLVDDITTTGATLCDCIRALRERFPTINVHVYTLGFTHNE